MTDSKNSDLFGNNDLYPNKRQYDELEPYVATESPTFEPLFPASSATSSASEQSWLEATPESIVYDYSSYQNQTYDEQSYSNVNLDAAETPSEQPQQEIHESHSTETNDIYALPPQEIQPAAYAQELAEPDASTLSDVAPNAAASEDLEQDARYTATEMSNAVAQQGDSGWQEESDEASALAVETPMREQDVVFNRHFAVLTDLMQHGAWPQALEKLQAMRTEYPNVEALDALLDEATLKTELMVNWAHKIKGRRLTVSQEWLLRRSLPFMLLLTLFISGAIFYQNFIAPSRQVMAMERANQALIEEATTMLQVGQVDAAIGLYDLVLSRNPDNSAAQQGLRDAESLSDVAATYDIAIRVANSGNLKRSLSMLQSVKAQSPSFRDIDARIERVSSLLEAEQAYQLAEKAFVQHRWADAITHYEETQLLAFDYQAVRVDLQLSAAYFLASQKLMNQWPADYTTEQIRDFLRRGMEVNDQDESLRFFLTKLDDFIKGERALNSDNLDHAVKLWSKLYEAQPDFLGGYLAEQLYRAYLALGAKMRNGDVEYASELYTLAATLPVHDSSEARTQLRSLGAATPVAQPTPTPRPTVAYVAPVAAAAPAALPPTPVPTEAPTNPYQGWVAFRSTRDGGEQVYIMRGDGSEQQLAPEELRGQLDLLYQGERRGSDGQLAFVQAATGRSDANIYIASSDGANKREVTNYNGDEYDPVLSRNGDRLAFVANHTGNDEIWTMRTDGTDARQLTNNNWEWDKHPTWSPDGSEIAFFSNRSGQRQIWVMGSDGSNQRNLSNNGYDDWDPVWIK